MVESVRWVIAFIVMGKELGGCKWVVGLLAQGAVGDVVLAGESVGIGTIDPRNVEVVPDDGEDGVRVVWLF